VSVNLRDAEKAYEKGPQVEGWFVDAPERYPALT